jgi:hypothetical protein
MERGTRCRLTVAALFALSWCAVPSGAQDEPAALPPVDPVIAPDAGNTGQGLAEQPVPGSPAQDVYRRQPSAPSPGYVPGTPYGQTALPPGTAKVWQPDAVSPMPQSPEMAKKMRAILALREMWQLRLTARDIASILPDLKELAEAEKNLQAKSEKLLDDERRALLTADPDGDPPPSNGDLLQRENELFRIKSADVWRNIERSLGRTKTSGLRRLLGQDDWLSTHNGDGNNPFGGTVPAQLGQTPRAGDDGVQPTPGLSGAVTAPRNGGRQDAPPRVGRARRTDPTAPSGTGLTAPGGFNPGQAVNPPIASTVTGRVGGQVAPSGNGSVPAQAGRGTYRYQVTGVNLYPSSAPFVPQTRISLPELVSLLGDKLAAMRR